MHLVVDLADMVTRNTEAGISTCHSAQRTNHLEPELPSARANAVDSSKHRMYSLQQPLQCCPVMMGRPGEDEHVSLTAWCVSTLDINTGVIRAALLHVAISEAPRCATRICQSQLDGRLARSCTLTLGRAHLG